MTKKRKLLVLGIISLLMVAAFLAVSKLRWVIAKKNYLKTEARFEKRLSKGEFIPIDNQSDLSEAIMSGIDTGLDSSGQSLSRGQKSALAARIMFLFKAYHDGSFDSFAGFRYPKDINNRKGMFDAAYYKNLQDSYDQLQSANNEAAGDDSVSAKPALNNPASLLKANYDLWVAAGAKWTNPIFCATCWQEAASGKLEVRLNIATNRIGSVGDSIKSENSLGTIRPPINFTVHPTPQEILKQGKRLTTAYVSIVVKTKEPAEILPIFVQFYWIDDYSDWIPVEFINGFGLSKFYHIIDL